MVTRTGRLAALLASVLFTLVAPSAARASLSSGVRLRWVGERPKPAQAGREFVGQLEVASASAGQVQNFELSGRGWTVRGLDAPAVMSLSKGRRQVVTFRAVPSDPAEPLTIRYTWGGRTIEKNLRLDAASIERAYRKNLVRFDDRAGPKLSGMRPRSQQAGQRATTTAFHFSGTFQYTRGDGTIRGADGIKVEVVDQDPIVDEVIWSGFTDLNGHFDVNTLWDDCDLSGCDDPDIYLQVTAETGVVGVMQDIIFGVPYVWVTPVIPDFTGNNVDFGVMHPDNNTDEDAAVHIFNSITRADRYARQFSMAAERVEVEWPDDDTPTSYTPSTEVIHISHQWMWDELTHTHEYGHHLNNVYGNLLDPDYQNGFCDTPTPGHCVWCPEHVGEAWQEGFADWWGQLVTEDYPVTYGYSSWAGTPNANGQPNDWLYQMDWLNKCQQDSTNYPGALTEGYVMALLRDIQDPVNDDHDGGAPDCDMDATSLGADEIMTVFRDDDPTDITMFLNSFRARYPFYSMDLWSTVRNVDPGLGFPLPDPVVNNYSTACRLVRTGESTTLVAQGDGSLEQYQWRRNGVNLADGPGVSGSHATSLVLSSLSVATAAGDYDCVVKTCDGTKSVTSTSTHLTVFGAPPTSHPYLTWGENSNWQCGNGTNTFQLPPGTYTHLANVVQMDGTRSCSEALLSDGSLYTWGNGSFGELGNGTATAPSPVKIGVTNAIQIATGYYHILALLRDGSVVGWGSNQSGELGDSTTIQRNLPVRARTTGCITAVAAGQNFSLALTSDGTVLSWGYNGLGSLGRGTIGGNFTTPAPVVGLTNVIAIAAGNYTGYALRGDLTVWAWGYNAFGELGNGTTTNSGTPVQVQGLSQIHSIAGTQANGYAVTGTGAVYAWGRGGQGAIGNGSFADQLTPVLANVSGVTKVVAGEAGWAMALLSDGTLKAWGYNVNGVLGTGAIAGTNQNAPQSVLGAAAVVDIAAGWGTAHVLGYMSGVTAVATEGSGPAPVALNLRVAPVPSRDLTSLAFELPRSGPVTVAVFDVAGRVVRTLVSDSRSAGRYQTSWDGRTRSGQGAPAGVYFARLEGAGTMVTRRIVLMK
jgi:alpha-tubulin suppressor-like RCC1 family protein